MHPSIVTAEGLVAEKLTTAVELFEVLPEEPVVSSQPRSWHGITADYYHHRPNSLASPMLQEHLVTLNCGNQYKLIQRLDGRGQTPTFFINGVPHHSSWQFGELMEVIEEAGWKQEERRRS